LISGRRQAAGGKEAAMYFTDRGIEELQDRRGEESATFAALAEHMRQFVDLNPEHEIPIDRLATWLARLDDSDDD
jgi:Family of unknown function (DUF6104)